MNILSPDIRLLEFIHLLREEGFAIGVQETIDSMHLLNAAQKPDEQLTHHIIRSLACRNHTEWQRYDDLFNDYWYPGRNKKNIPALLAQINGSRRRGGIAGISGSSKEHVDKLLENSDITGAGAGRQRTIARADFRFLNDVRAVREAERQAERLALLLRKRTTRHRTQTSHGDKIDVRKTLRNNLKFAGLPVRPVYTQRRREPLHIIILHDVSHSMAWNNPLLFRFARGIVRAFPESEAFAFHTRLFRVTSLYRERSLEIMRTRLEANNELWLGGTCIADSLNDFYRNHAGKILHRKSVVMIISDGFDTNEPVMLGNILEKIRSHAGKIIWLNPMLGREGFEPDPAFMQFAAPHLDRIESAHSVNALENAVRYLAGH